ncbi:hypothetical protein BOTBODRAFT_37737 [Botryobasidium botryosum FD-172 SS1]|uniref:L domain-like protein n=1 Tax=Botryobasidium botryosum (strain FD-172 SS1) TaxID=930990 RepID=A0A067LZM1_BOTB1|nr:hypothetical protein BOTBODRAFT_37737 [Botryobasidium botryosum FD-172 SS1]
MSSRRAPAVSTTRTQLLRAHKSSSSLTANTTPAPPFSSRPSSPTKPTARAVPTTPSKGNSLKAPAASSPFPRAKTPVSTSRAPSRASQAPPSPSKSFSRVESPTNTRTSIKEQIALKRAEAKKAQLARSKANDVDVDSSWNDGKGSTDPVEQPEQLLLGRETVARTVDKARTTGSLNLSARELDALPMCLFTLHLGVDPTPLASQKDEAQPKAGASSVSWYEAVDLTVIKARNNNLTELQPEIGLFGSLKVIDLHGNKLSSLPREFSDLVFLTHLDLSANAFSAVPAPVIYIPTLMVLDLSQNGLTDFSWEIARASGFGPQQSSDFPSLQTLLLAENKLTAVPDRQYLPDSLVSLSLANNSLSCGPGSIASALGHLLKLKELNFHQCSLSDSALEQPVPASQLTQLQKFDVGENEGITQAGVEIFFGKRDNQALRFEVGVGAESVLGTPGYLKVIIGGKTVKEDWEIEADRRGRRLRGARPPPAANEELGKPAPEVKVVEKEQWELDAEAGLLNEGRRRRAAAAAAAAPKKSTSPPASTSPKPNPDSPAALDKYYESTRHSLELPSALPNLRNTLSHSRSQSLSANPLASKSGSGQTDLQLPQATLPLAVIASQAWATTLRSLTLSNRRADVSVLLSGDGEDALDALGLPVLDELYLDGCNLGDEVLVKYEPGASHPQSKQRPLFSTLAALFPSLKILDLSFNAITAVEGVEGLFFRDPSLGDRVGLKALRLKGNRIASLDGLERVGERFARGDCAGWKGEEIDIRDNEIAKLPPILGLVPLEVFLVEGNTFRAPGRRVWEREGTKGLLRWLKDSYEC